MNQDTSVYAAPTADLKKDIDESFNESFESISAFENLKLLWMLRGVADVLILLVIINGCYEYLANGYGLPFIVIAFYMVLGLFALLELYFIVLFFKKRKKSIMALHIFSFFSLLNVPIGTAFSIYHYLKSRKLEWPPA